MKNRHVALSIVAVTTIICLTLAMRTQNPTVLTMAALAVGQLASRFAGNKTGRDLETVKSDLTETKDAAKTTVRQTNGEQDDRIAAAVARGNRRLIERLEGLETRIDRLENPPPPPGDHR